MQSDKQPQKGDLRIYYSSNGLTRLYPVKDVEEGKYLFTKLAEGDVNNGAVDWNVIDLEVFEDLDIGDAMDWCTWYDEEGRSISDILDEEREA
jgi:hypothetical protein